MLIWVIPPIIKKYLWILLALGLATRFLFFSYPAETVFDEVHFGKFVSGYFTGEYFFDIHPPLGKLLIAGVAKISDFQPGFSFQTIGQKFPDDSYKWLRFLPKLAGAFLPVVIFLIALELGLSQKFAFLAGLLIVFENSLLVQSRLILLDSFLLLFGFLGVLFFLKSGNISYKRSLITNSNKKLLFLSGFFSSLAFSVKWTGLTFLAVIILSYFINWLKSEGKIKLAAKGLVFLIIIPFIIYFLIFAVHFSLLNKPGPGLAFHPPNFQQTSIFDKFIELNKELYKSNARLSASHPYTSQWYQWPFMNKPIYYWNSSNTPQGTSEKIYFIGNPLIWWLSTVFIIYSLINFRKFKSTTFYFLLTTYFLNWLPFIFIGRVMFLYHYFTSLIFAILILAYVLAPSKRSSQDSLLYGASKSVFNIILISALILFLFFSPLSYGFPIPDWYYKMTVWLPSWK
ncbi:MAG: glycosyl transferase family protein [Parcubacteria group bacterium Gr01-1014_2]|nr:MAG: glycosyl transferase family protein [Parcubacteria group bacterium Gr01-1014_2]